MPYDRHDTQAIDRRTFIKASLIPAAFPIAAVLASPSAEGAQPAPGPVPSGPDIVDANVHLFAWPFRKLKYASTEALVAKLRRHRITQAWAGSFEAVLHKQLDAINRALAEECKAHGNGMLVPFGSVNPAWPDWEEDVRRCHEQYRMPGLRLYPAYHRYTLDHPEFVRLLGVAAQRGMVVQIVMRLEDERVHHAAIDVPLVNPTPLADVVKKVPQAKVQLINSAGPLLGNSVSALVRETQVTFDIAATEGNGGVGRLIEGTNPSYRGAIPADRLVFGSHAPYFPCESALLKLFESPLSLEQLEKLMNANVRRLIA
ncbi:MAG: amidohydrolase family protein [Planctomycetes bacterium]|nr:amidohydrolase family protein [Planctomycetota bacterium]